MVCKVGISFDEVLTNHIGEFGSRQRAVVFLTSLIWIANAFVFFAWVFMATNPAWNCNDPQDAICQAVWAGRSTQLNFCDLSPAQWHWSNTDSVVARYNLVCSQAWKVQFVNTLMFIGCFIGAAVWGWMNDNFGRRYPLFIATALIAAATLASTASPSYWFLAATRALAGIGGAGQSQCIVLICAETTGPAYRGLAGSASLVFITFGEFLLVAIASSFPSWSKLALAAGILNAAALLLFPFIPESARWLMSKGRAEEAVTVMRRLSSNNGSLPEAVAAALITSAGSKSSTNGKGNSSKAGVFSAQDTESCVKDNAKGANTFGSDTQGNCSGSMHHLPVTACGETQIAAVSSTKAAASSGGGKLTLLRLLLQPTHLLRTAVLLLAYFTLYVTAYGMVLGAGALPGTIYMTFTMMAAAELTAMLLGAATVEKLGRHNLVAAGLLIGAVGCVGCAAAPGTASQAVLAVFGKFGCSLSLAVIGTYAAELFPTAIRATAMGKLNQASRIGSITAPCMLLAGAALPATSHGPLFLPLLVFGALSLLTCVLVLLVLPETHGLPMPECAQDLEQLQSVLSARPQGFWPLLSLMFRCTATPPKQATAAPTTLAAEKVQVGSVLDNGLCPTVLPAAPYTASPPTAETALADDGSIVDQLVLCEAGFMSPNMNGPKHQ